MDCTCCIVFVALHVQITLQTAHSIHVKLCSATGNSVSFLIAVLPFAGEVNILFDQNEFDHLFQSTCFPLYDFMFENMKIKLKSF